MAEYGNPNEWQSEVIVCKGGLSLDTDALTSGTTQQGTAKVLQNFECALEGGYRRINGYTKWDSTTVPGDANTEILGVKAALGGVFAARKGSVGTGTTGAALGLLMAIVQDTGAAPIPVGDEGTPLGLLLGLTSAPTVPTSDAPVSADGTPLGLLLSLTSAPTIPAVVGATTSSDIYFSAGSGWNKINTDTRGGEPEKVRFITYSINKPVVVGCDGVNYAFKYDGAAYTVINGIGAPLDPKYAEMFNASLALAGQSASPSSVIITAPNTDTDFAAGHGAVEINVGDTIVALKNFRNSLYVFCTNRIFKIVLDSVSTYALQLVTAQIGCIAGDTVQEVGGDLIYLAADGFRSVAGTYNIGDVDLSLQSRSIQPIIRPVLANISNQVFSSCVVREKSQYRCIFHDPSVSRENTKGVIGKVEQGSPLSNFNQTYTEYVWTTTIGIQCHCMDSYFDSGTERVVMGDHSNGYVYLLESGNSFDGTDIPAVYQSPYLTFKDASLRKVMQKATIYTEVEGTNSINLNLLFDFQNTGVLQPAPQTLDFGGAFPLYGSAIYSVDTYGGIVFPVFKQNLVGSGFTTAFQFTSTGGAPYRIDSYQIVFSNKGRR